MKKPAWKDTSSHSRYASVKEPNSWTLGTEHRTSILLHRHVSEPGVWFVTCYAIDLTQRPLVAIEVEAAKAEALVRVRDRNIELANYYKKLGVPL